MGSLAVRLDAARADQSVVEHMIAAAPHRGSRATVARQGGCALAVANQDGLEDASIARDDGLAAAFCGSLDNESELTATLGAPAGPDRPASAADVVIRAFRAFGEDVPKHLRGAFAAVVSDGARIWSFRDHVGLGSLFYRRENGSLVLASEPKQVIAGSKIAAEPDIDVVERLFFGRYDDKITCAIRGVSRVPGASLLRSENGSVGVRRYWDPESLLETARFSPDELAERFEHLMTQAVARTVRGRDAVSLSGGIDSPAVAAFAAPAHLEVGGRPLTGISSVYPDLPSVDESRYIEMVAAYLDIPVHAYVQKARRLERLDEWTRLVDGPVPVNLADLEEQYRTARSRGLRTILTGDLAELAFDMSGHLISHLLLHGRFRPLARLAREMRTTGASRATIARQLVAPLVPGRLVRILKRGGVPNAPAWLDHRAITDPYDYLSLPARHRWERQQVKAFAGPGITMEADDVVQQLCGVRVRRPFGDVDLWEFFLSLPAETKFPATQKKALMRRLLRGRLPDPILDRRDKTSFRDYVMSRIDYRELRRWLVAPAYRIRGVDYELLARQLEAERLGFFEYMWAKDLATTHAFLSLW